MSGDLSDMREFLPKQRPAWVPVAIAVSIIGAVAAFLLLYDKLPDRGPTLSDAGYLIELPNGRLWAMLNSGNAVPISQASAKLLNAKPGRCSRLEGNVENSEIDLRVTECTAGEPVLPVVVDRMRFLHAKFGYWAESLTPKSDDLEPYLLKTPEVVAAVIDPRADDPQIVPLYVPLFPATLTQERLESPAPPVIISIRRNDMLINRYRRAPLDEFLKPDSFIFAGAAHNGGWLVRELLVTLDGAPSLERLLVAPAEAPWPEKMSEFTLRVARAGAVLDAGSSASVQTPAIDGGSAALP